MRWVVASSLRFRRLVVAAAVALMAGGALGLQDTKVDALPEFAPPVVEIRTEALGLSAAEVEQLITVPLEADLLNGVAWLDEIRSESVSGLSEVELIFEPGTDILRARQVVAERLTGALGLPQVSKPPEMLQPLSSTNRAMMVGLSSDKLSLVELSVLARWDLRPKLMGVPGVANVSIYGQRERQLQVQVDPKQLREEEVSLQQVMETTGNALWVSPLSFVEASTPGTGGFIDTPNQRLTVQHVSPIVGAADLARVAVEESEGLRLSDVAKVVENHQPLIGDAITKDGANLRLVIEKFPGVGATEVTGDVEDALDEMRSALPGVQIDSGLYQPASFIDTALGNLGWMVLLGLVLVAAFFALLLFEWRAAVISLVAVSLSVMTAALLLHLRGATFNLMLLAGLVVALGVVVDDAIVDVDTMKRRLARNRQEGGGRPAESVVVDASLERRGPAVFATLVILVAVVPVLVLGGLTGEFSRPLMLSYVLAVLASMLVALTVTPVLGFLLLSKAPLQRHTSPVTRWLQGRYDLALSRLVGRPVAAYVAVAVMAAAGLAAVPSLGDNEILPPLRERDLLFQWDAPAGTSHPEMARITDEASRELRALPGVSGVGALVGRAIGSDQVVDVNSGELLVHIDPDADYDTTVDAVHEVVNGYPGLLRQVQTYPEQRIREVKTGTDDDLVVRVFGQDPETLRESADQAQQAISKVDGVETPRVDQGEQEPTVEVQVDLAAAERHGVKPGDVRRAAATLISGVGVGSLFDRQKVFDVVVWGTPEIRHSLTSVRELLIDKPGEGQVRLGDVADVRVSPNPTVIKRESVSRYMDVVATVDGRDLDSVTSDVEAQLQRLDFPIEYHAEVVGDPPGQFETQGLWGVSIAAAIGVLLFLQAAFGSWRLASLLFVTLPVAVAGGVIAAWAGIETVSLAALAGLFTVLGIAARNSIMFVRHYQWLEREEGEPVGPGLVLRGSRERFLPVVLTAGATALALTPALVLGNIPGLEVVRPVAVVVLGGLVTTTIFSLFVVPSLYLRFASGPRGETPGPYAAPSHPREGHA
ncbi:MAG: efflux RND transporter permease subunit [Streptomycetales bacterium]